jgi:hypothetical protein
VGLKAFKNYLFEEIKIPSINAYIHEIDNDRNDIKIDRN